MVVFCVLYYLALLKSAFYELFVDFFQEATLRIFGCGSYRLFLEQIRTNTLAEDEKP